jgi:hypothetical protein
MQTQTPQQFRATFLRRPITPWHAVWAGVFALLGSSWLFSTAVFTWPSQKLPAVGAFIVPLSFLAGLLAFAFSVVAAFRRRDSRLLFAALLGAAAIALFTISFLIAARE